MSLSKKMKGLTPRKRQVSMQRVEHRKAKRNARAARFISYWAPMTALLLNGIGMLYGATGPIRSPGFRSGKTIIIASRPFSVSMLLMVGAVLGIYAGSWCAVQARKHKQAQWDDMNTHVVEGTVAAICFLGAGVAIAYVLLQTDELSRHTAFATLDVLLAASFLAMTMSVARLLIPGVHRQMIAKVFGGLRGAVRKKDSGDEAEGLFPAGFPGEV